jgi:hypothetical protein
MPPILGFGASQQVVVYSFVTDAGCKFASPTKERPARCALGSGGYREWGGIRAGETPTRLEQIDPLVRAALQLNAYEPLRRNETPDIVLVFHWGCMRPDPSGLGNPHPCRCRCHASRSRHARAAICRDRRRRDSADGSSRDCPVICLQPHPESTGC